VKFKTQKYWMLLLLPLISVLPACKSTQQLPPVEQLSQPPSIRLNYHTVSRGDSLYTIAWLYGVDFHELAQINHLSPPYALRNGQKIMLDNNSTGRTRAASRTVSPASGVQVMAVQNDSAVREVTPSTTTAAPSTASHSSPAAAGSDRVARPAPSQPAVSQSAASTASTTATSSGRWAWPTQGRVISQYSANDPLRKGIDLAGKLGDPVKAAGSGSVVYAGSGLAGYGQLIIIKHDEQFLSAYGHNSKLLVAEGDTVKKGQIIAEVGSSGTDSNKLHFEIRQLGKPVDPMLYLPRR
jgi:lipoprotein NlpD